MWCLLCKGGVPAPARHCVAPPGIRFVRDSPPLPPPGPLFVASVINIGMPSFTLVTTPYRILHFWIPHDAPLASPPLDPTFRFCESSQTTPHTSIHAQPPCTSLAPLDPRMDRLASQKVEMKQGARFL
eukprot:9477335-Pyramimonas_sp.AAC.2